MIEPSAGRSTPRIRPWTKSAVAMIAPELPAEIQPSARPSLQSRAQTFIDESGFDRTACAGCSSIPMTCVHGTSVSLGCRSSRGCTEPGRPTTEMSIPYSVAAWEAPSRICPGALSPPMASTAIRMKKRLDVEVADALGVRLDELLARLDVGPHHFLERVVHRRGVVDGDAQQHAGLRVHGRLPQLVGVHLAQTLHARGLGVLAQLPHRLVAIRLGVAPNDLRVLARALADLEERRLGHVQVALLDDLREVAVEEGKQQRADVAAVDVGVGHGHDAVVAHLLDVEVVADARAHRGDEVADLVRGEDLVQARLLDVENLAAQGQDRLRAPVAPALGGASGRVALDDVELALRRVALRAVGQLARQHARLEEALALDEVARLARRLARAGRGERLLDDPAALRWILLEVLRQAFGQCQRDVALHFGIAELALGLALELRLQHLHADHRREAFAHVFAGEVGIRLLQDAGLARVAVEHVGQGSAEPGQVAAALDGVDGVGEREHVLDERVVVLQRDLDLGALDLALDVERRRVDHHLAAIQGAHERDDAALEVEGVRHVEVLVGERDLEPLVEVGHLAEAVLDDLAVELRVREDLRVGPEPDDGAGVVGLAGDLHRGLRHAAVVFLVVDLAAEVHPHLELLAQEVHRRHTYPVQARRDLVAAAAELAAGVEAGHHQLERGDPLLLVDVDRNAPAVVLHRAAAVRVEGGHDPGGVAGQGLVHGVVDHLIDQVMQAARARRADVHARPPPNVLPAFEDLDLLGGIRHIRAKGFGPATRFRQGFSDRHYREIGPPSVENS